MLLKNERGQAGVSQILGVLIGIVVAIVVILSIINFTQGAEVGSAISDAIDTVNGVIMNVLDPTLGTILGLSDEKSATETNALMILTFILISIIIVGTLNSVNLFGEQGKSGNFANLAIGIIVAIIGVRFMPENLWQSLTAPSSAFVATILVGIPFAALGFITARLGEKYKLASKLLWLFYVIFMSFLIFGMGGYESGAAFMWVYIVFLILGGAMMFFDSTVRKFFYKEKEQKELEDMLGKMGLKQRHKLRQQISEWQDIANDENASKQDKEDAKKKIDDLKKEYGDNLDRI